MVMVLADLSLCVKGPQAENTHLPLGLQLCSGLTGDVADSHVHPFVCSFLTLTRPPCVHLPVPLLPFVSTASMEILYPTSVVQL